MNKPIVDTLTTAYAALLTGLPKNAGIFDPECYMTRAVKQVLNSPATSMEMKKTKKNVNRLRGSKRKGKR